MEVSIFNEASENIGNDLVTVRISVIWSAMLSNNSVNYKGIVFFLKNSAVIGNYAFYHCK